MAGSVSHSTMKSKTIPPHSGPSPPTSSEHQTPYSSDWKDENSPWTIPLVGNHWLLCRLLVASLALVCYLNSSWGGFVFDDSEAIINNKDLTPEVPLSELFSHDFWGTSIARKTSHKSYRPLTVLTFRWNYQLAGGLEPWPFHLTNVVLHALVSWLYLEVCCCLLGDWPWGEGKFGGGGGGKQRGVSACALIAAVLFAAHPVHTECVAGVVGRAELTSALCFFAALLSYIRSCRSGGRGRLSSSLLWLALTVALAACAMLFKEQGITVLGVCIVYDVIVHMKIDPLWIHQINSTPSGGWKVCVLRVGTVLISAVLLLLLRFQLMATGPPQFTAVDNPASFADSLLTRFLSFQYLYSLNAWLLLAPWWLCFDWSMGCVPLLVSLADTRILAIVIFWVGLGSLVAYSLLGRPKQYKRLVVFSLSLVVVPFLPASNLFFRVGFVIAERVLYLPSAGHCLLVALGASTLRGYLRRGQQVVSLVMTLLIAAFVARSVQRSSEWLTEESLFFSGARVCPLNAKVHYNIGKVMADSGSTAEGEAEYREAVRLYPDYDQALNNLGNLLKETSRPREAEEMFHRALKANPEFAAAWMNLGIVQASLNKTGEAEQSYKKAVQHRKKYPDAYYNLGNLYLDMRHHGEAIAAFKTAITLQKDHSNSWHNLGLLYEDLEMYKEAETAWRDAIALMPEQPQFYFSLGVLLGKIQKLEDGEELLLKATTMNPAVANYHANLGVIYHLKKQYSLAEQSYQHALSLDPGLAIAKENLQKLLKTRQKLSI